MDVRHMNRIYSFVVTLFFVLIVYPLSVVILPLFRIPKGGEVVFKLKLKPKVFPFPDFIRPWGENVFGNVAVFFSHANHDEPQYLYMSKKEVDRLPEDTRVISSDRSSPKRTAVLTVKTSESYLGGFLPASLVSFEVIDGIPEWTK
jgi:hypothetical protein